MPASFDFTVVVYHVGNVVEAWKWWFGGVIFFALFFCVAKCLLCPRRAMQVTSGAKFSMNEGEFGY